jgi:hypothetical protein
MVGGSTSEAMVCQALNVVLFMNTTEQPEHAKNDVSSIWHLCLSAVVISMVCQVVIAAPPAPHPRTHGGSTQPQPATLPTSVIAEVRLPPKAAEDIAAEARDRAEREANDRDTRAINHRLFGLGVVQAIVFLLQLAVFAYQALKLRETVEAAAQQSQDMQNSIRESARVATGIEALGTSVAASARSAAESVATLKERTALQMRAYLSVEVGEATYQERDKGYRFEARPFIVNSGNTPAHKVRFWAKAEILPVPLPAGHELPDGGPFGGEAVVGPRQHTIIGGAINDFVDDNQVDAIKAGKGQGLYIWGQVKYEDAFGELHETHFCHHTTWRSNTQIFIYFLAGRNTAT